MSGRQIRSAIAMATDKNRQIRSDSDRRIAKSEARARLSGAWSLVTTPTHSSPPGRPLRSPLPSPATHRPPGARQPRRPPSASPSTTRAAEPPASRESAAAPQAPLVSLQLPPPLPAFRPPLLPPSRYPRHPRSNRGRFLATRDRGNCHVAAACAATATPTRLRRRRRLLLRSVWPSSERKHLLRTVSSIAVPLEKARLRAEVLPVLGHPDVLALDVAVHTLFAAICLAGMPPNAVASARSAQIVAVLLAAHPLARRCDGRCGAEMTCSGKSVSI